eukprot:11223266-Lingulodinium_polyedra.AAC.1
MEWPPCPLVVLPSSPAGSRPAASAPVSPPSGEVAIWWPGWFCGRLERDAARVFRSSTARAKGWRFALAPDLEVE